MFVKLFAGNLFYNIKTRYICTVFFMVLDLRLRRWVVVMTTFFVFIPFLFIIPHSFIEFHRLKTRMVF